MEIVFILNHIRPIITVLEHRINTVAIIEINPTTIFTPLLKAIQKTLIKL